MSSSLPLTDSETSAILQSGDAAEHCLRDATVIGVIETLSQEALGSIVHSAEAAVDAREGAYRRIRALKDIVGELERRVATRNALIQQMSEAQEDDNDFQDFNDYYNPSSET